MSHFARMLNYIQRAIKEFGFWFGAILSWPLWLPLILAGSILGLWFRKEDLVMVLLTIQTSVDSAATKMLQNHVRAKDEGRDALMQEQVAAIDAMLVEVRNTADLLVDMLRAAEERDRLAARRDALSAKRDKVMLNALEARADLIDFLQRGGEVKRESPGKTRRPTGGKRTAHGRRARTQP